MPRGYLIGRLLGIEIRVDGSWLFILLLMTGNLATAFGSIHSDWGSGLRWGTALAAALLFFASVLAHELAHSIVARRRGIPVHDITLYFFGGASNLKEEPESPAAEFWMALWGPATSVLIGLALVGLVQFGLAPLAAILANPTQALRGLGSLSTLLLWVGTTNLSLAAFNLIPGFPLDGGRILRSVLWSVTGDLSRATRWAATVGQTIAMLMMLGGASMIFGARIPFFGAGFGNGLWLAFLGWFLNSASERSYRQVVVQDILEGVPVSKMMRSDPPAVSPGISVREFVDEHMMGTDDHSFPVVEDGQFAGMVTLQDVRSVPRADWDTRSVAEIMTPAAEVTAIDPDTDASEALKALVRRDVRQLPVLRGTELVGAVCRRDIIRWLQLESQIRS